VGVATVHPEANPPPDSAFTQTLEKVAERVCAGEDLRFAAREFLDEVSLRLRDDLRQRAIEAPCADG